MRRLFLRFLTLLAGLAAIGAPAARADRAEDLARIHVEVIGGRERIAALQRLRASGAVFVAGKQVKFTMLAARPAKVRLETENAGRTHIQAYDGVEAPWEFERGATPERYRDMPEASAKTFIGDSEFDDPLVAGATRGYTLDYAGELQVDGRKLHRILVTRKMTETFSVMVDDETCLITLRVEHRTSAGGRKVQVVTHYEDFRPVEGVLLPHQVTVTIDGKVNQQTKIARIEANPKLGDELFRRPKVSVPGLSGP